MDKEIKKKEKEKNKEKEEKNERGEKENISRADEGEWEGEKREESESEAREWLEKEFEKEKQREEIEKRKQWEEEKAKIKNVIKSMSIKNAMKEAMKCKKTLKVQKKIERYTDYFNLAFRKALKELSKRWNRDYYGLTAPTLTKIREGFLMGCTIKEACIYANISQETLKKYLEKSKYRKELLEYFKLLKTNPILKARKTIYDNLDDVNIAKWYLTRKRREEFAIENKKDENEIKRIEVIFNNPFMFKNQEPKEEIEYKAQEEKKEGEVIEEIG
ncbi:MAG TPA: hypothetical protein PLD27_12155 [bacterium]|nr:hypothetical protein [bacterium]